MTLAELVSDKLTNNGWSYEKIVPVLEILSKDNKIVIPLDIDKEAYEKCPFDIRNLISFFAGAKNIFEASPEAIALFGGIVYPSQLKKADIQRVVWVNRNGQDVVDAPTICATIDTLLMLLESAYARLYFHKQQLADGLEPTSELTNEQKEKEPVKTN